MARGRKTDLAELLSLRITREMSDAIHQHAARYDLNYSDAARDLIGSGVTAHLPVVFSPAAKRLVGDELGAVLGRIHLFDEAYVSLLVRCLEGDVPPNWADFIRSALADHPAGALSVHVTAEERACIEDALSAQL